MPKFTCSPSQCRPRSSERWVLGDSWAGGLRPWFCANVNDLLHRTCSGKRCRAQLSKQRGRGRMEAPLFIQLVLNASLLANVLENLFHYPRNGKNQESCKLSLSLPASILKPSAEREELCYIWAIMYLLCHQLWPNIWEKLWRNKFFILAHCFLDFGTQSLNVWGLGPVVRRKTVVTGLQSWRVRICWLINWFAFINVERALMFLSCYFGT